MALSVPSFFAAATSASMPPRSAAVVALAASFVAPAAPVVPLEPAAPAALVGTPAPDFWPAELLLDEQAAALRARTAAVAAMPVKRRFTVFLPVGGGRESAA